jgi:hypothetical protein
MTSHLASVTIMQCFCTAGYSRFNTTTCIECDAGTYKPDSENETLCEPCRNGTFSDVTGMTFCHICGPGTSSVTGSLACQPCEAGTYSSIMQETNSSACLPCPPFTVSPEGSADVTQCICQPGSFNVYGLDGVACTPCRVGAYKSTNGTGNCTACLPHSFNFEAGSASEEDCVCDAGWMISTEPSDNGACACAKGFTNEEDTKVCQPCPANHYKPYIGQGACVPCVASSWAAQGSVDVSMCQCNAGYTRSAGHNCSACPQGYFKDWRGPESCSACAPGSFSSALAASTRSQCTACPSFTGSLAASTSVLDCVCIAGYAGEAGKGGAGGGNPNVSCIPCPVGSYKQENGMQACTLCGLGTFSTAVGATHVDLCTPCHSKGATTTALGASHPDNCTCSRGYTGAGSNCTACGANLLKTTLGSSGCSACRAFSTSPPASGFAADCRCIDGYLDLNASCALNCGPGQYIISSSEQTGGKASQRCGTCPPSTFQPLVGAPNSSSCLPCGRAAYSEAGSRAFLDCRCSPGYVGYPIHPQVLNLLALLVNKYKN